MLGENVKTSNDCRKLQTNDEVSNEISEPNDKVQSGVEENEQLADEERCDHLHLLKTASVRLKEKNTGSKNTLNQSSQSHTATSEQSPHLHSDIIELLTDDETGKFC